MSPQRAIAFVTLRGERGTATEAVLEELLETGRIERVDWLAHRIRIPRRHRAKNPRR